MNSKVSSGAACIQNYRYNVRPFREHIYYWQRVKNFPFWGHHFSCHTLTETEGQALTDPLLGVTQIVYRLRIAG